MNSMITTLEGMALPKKPDDLTLSALIREAADIGDTERVLSMLTGQQLAALGKAALADELKDAIRQKIKTARIDINAELAAWLDCYQSDATKATYRRALDILTAWTDLQGIELASMTPAQADAWLAYEKGNGQDTDTTLTRAAAVSAFYSFMERRHPDAIRNPIRGTKARPKRTTPVAIIPTPEEIQTIARAAAAREDWVLFGAVLFLTATGCRVGALPDLTIRKDGYYTTHSKGKDVLGADPLPADVLTALAALGARPFSQYRGRKLEAIKSRFFRLCRALHKAGQINAKYSPHDLRHAYAEQHKGKGLYWLKEALGHCSVSVTELYLKNVLKTDPRTIEGRE